MENLDDNTQIIEYNVQEIENYMDIINHIKAQIDLDEMGLTDEVSKLIKECKNEIITLRNGIEDLRQENMEIFSDNCLMARQLYVNEKLMEVKSETKKDKLKKLLLQCDKNVVNLSLEQIDIIIGEV